MIPDFVFTDIQDVALGGHDGATYERYGALVTYNTERFHFFGVDHPNEGCCEPAPFTDLDDPILAIGDPYVCHWCGRVCW